MKTLNENLAELFNVDPIPVSTNPLAIIPKEIPDSNISVIEEDTEYARTNIRKLINDGIQAAEQLLLISTQSEQPRAFEVFTGLLKTLSELNHDLLLVHKTKNSLIVPTNNNPNTTDVNINNAIVFQGSTNQLLKIIKDQQ
jgi:hypothetical protein